MTAHARRILPAIFALLALLPPNRLHAGVGEWTSSGPDGGVVQTLAAHPSHPSTVYAATFQRLFKSADGGVSWALTGLSVGPNLVLPTSDPVVVYATATWSPEIPVYRSRDGGQTWVERAGPLGQISSLIEDGNNPMALYAATSSGLFRTANGGDSWEPLSSPATGGAVAVAGIAVDPDPQILYAALDVGNLSGVYKSIDRGRTWTRTALVVPVRSLVIERVPAGYWDYGDGSRIFALTTAGLQVTDDGGASWKRLAPGLSDVSHFAIDPTGSSRLYVISGGSVFQSSDGGQTVTRVDGNFGRGVRGIVASGSGVVLVGSERGVSRSEDAGRVWSTANLGIRGLFVQSIAVDPTDPAVVFAAGNRGIFESRNGGETWQGPVPLIPDAESVAIDPTDRSTVYAAGAGGVYKSSDGGHTWQKKGPPSSVLADQISELVIDPNNPRRLFAAYAHVYQSLDGADTWRSVMTPDDDYSTYYGGPPTVAAMALAPSDSSTIYAGGETGFVYRSTDGGDNWSDLKAGFGVSALSVDSCDPRIVQAGGWNAVSRSLDGGETWTSSPMPWPANFPYGFVLALARDPRHSSSAFAGTTQGLFWTNDRGVSWSRFEPALDGIVQSLALDPTGRFLYAGTERGVFQLERTFETCAKGADRLCLLGAKYQVSVTARNPRTGASITGRAIEEGDRFGYFSFPDVTGDPNYPEVFVKMVDATNAPPPYGGHGWVFHSSLTDLDYTLTVLETETGRVRTYDAADWESLTCGRADTSAFERDCAAAVPASRTTPAGVTVGSGVDLVLLNGRFRATLQARDPRTGRTAAGTAIARGDAFGYFSLPFFTGDPNYPEIFVKMADATAQPGGSFWVFHTGLTDLEYTLTVTDRVIGAVRTYTGGATDGTRLCGSADTAAFRN